MRKNISIIILLGVVIVAFGYFTIFITPASIVSDKVSEDQDKLGIVPTEPGKKTPEPRKGKGTLESLRQLNENFECTIFFSEDEKQTDVEGTYFVSEGRMRGDFLTSSEEFAEPILNSMIIADGFLYSWSVIDRASYGVKMAFSEEQNSEDGNNLQVSIYKDVNYDCKPWPYVDKTVFAPPADILFRDAKEMIETGMEYGTIYEEE